MRKYTHSPTKILPIVYTRHKQQVILMHTKRAVSRIAILLLSTSLHAKVLLWDLGGVLCEPTKAGVAMEIGLNNFINHAFWDMRSPDIRPTLFDVLTMMMPRDPSLPLISGSHTGVLLPPIMSHWQAGTITGEEIIIRSRQLLRKLNTYDYFDSDDHMDLISRCIRAMFTPEVLANNVSIAPEGYKLLQECARLKNNDGSKRHRLFVFSNWDHLSFDIFRKKHIRFFNMFEHVVISGHIKQIKPSKEAYDYLIDTYNLAPAECILIDDQEMNTRAAKQFGMKAALIKNRDYACLRRDLIRLGVLDS